MPDSSASSHGDAAEIERERRERESVIRSLGVAHSNKVG
jgi:hypothetical protein